MNIDDVLNKKELYARVDDDVELLQELIDLFLEDYPSSLEEIHSAIAQGDAAKLKRAAHTLKGSVSNFCAERAVQLAFKLEQSGAANDLSTAGEDYEALCLVMRQVSDALTALSGEALAH